MIDRQTEEITQFEIHKCIVCNGFGTLKFGQIKCHACNGRGYITIDKLTGLPVEISKNGK
jgi:DnaJ-class molecular chaperone